MPLFKKKKEIYIYSTPEHLAVRCAYEKKNIYIEKEIYARKSVKSLDERTDCHYHDHDHSLSSRFSSGDLSSELDDEPSTDSGLASMARDSSSQSYQAVPERPLQSQPTPVPPASQPPVPGAPPPGPPQPVGGDLSLNLRPGSRTTSAPSSPAKTRESLLQRVQSLTGAARDQVGWTFLFFDELWGEVEVVGGTEDASWKSDIRVILNMTNIGEKLSLPKGVYN